MMLVTVAVAAVVLIAVARGGEGGDGADVRTNTIQTIVDRGELEVRREADAARIRLPAAGWKHRRI